MNIFSLSRSFFLVAALCFVALAVPGVAAAGLQQVGTLSNGPSFDLVESNGYLYAGQGSEVVTYDVSTSAKISALTWKSALSQLPVGSSVKGVCVDSGYLYIAASSKFVIADISRPSSPVIVSTLSSGGSDVLIKGNYAYLLSPGDGVEVIDISNKAAPRLVRTIGLAGRNMPWRGTINGNYLYVGLETDNRLDILDISIPSTPRLVGSYSPNNGINYVSGVAVKNGYAYITEYHNGVRVIDVTNPAKPYEVMNKLGINANDIKILGNYAYVSVRYEGFEIFDITNPRNPVLVGKATDAGSYNEGIYPTQSYTFLAQESMGFGIYGTSTVSAPKTLTRVLVVGGADSVVMRGGYLYIGAHNDGIWTVDVKTPSKPKEISFISNLGRNGDLDLVGSNLYVAGAWSSLSVINVADPVNPQMTLYHFGTSATAVLADGNYVYTDQGIVDMTNIKAPVYVSKSGDFAGGGQAKYGTNYLVVASSDGLHIIDVSNKKSPVTVTTFEPGTSYTDVKIRGTVAVAAVGNSIVTIDLSNVRAPKRMSQLTYSGVWYARALAINDAIVYAAGYGIDDVRAFDISNPAQIKLVDSIEIGGDFGTISYDNGYLAIGGKMASYILSTGTSSIASVTPAITVTDPNGGETWIRGSTPTISWTSSGSVGSYVKIELLKAGVVSQTISSSTPNDGSYGSWTVPTTLATGTDYRIRITSTTNSAITDTSNNYLSITTAATLSSASITVTTPNGGETWVRGTTPKITWTSSGSVGSYVKIELLKAGVVSQTISSSTPNDGTYASWTVPTTLATGTDYRIRVTSTTNAAITDTSNNYLSITTATTLSSASITVTTPNGGETWVRGTKPAITWTWSSSGSVESSVKIELLKAGVVSQTISSSTPNDGMFTSWTIPTTLATGTDYRIRITGTTSTAITDTSNTYFKIIS